MNRLQKGIRISFAVICLCVVGFAQENPRAFASVDAAFKKSRLQWSLASAPFQQERTRLGQDFEPELWKYLGEDVYKQDRIANFLIVPEYLHGNLPMPYLAMQIWLKSLSSLQGKTDLSSRSMYVTASINAAITAGYLDLLDLAELRKADAETMMAKDKFLTTSFPAIDDYDRCIYDSIGNHAIQSPAKACVGKKSASEPGSTTIEVVEIPKERILSKPQPKWPSSLKSSHASGTVTIEVLFDESGKVESADILSGPPDLQPAALKAAREARFQSTTYRGQAVKVRGPITYQF